MYLYAMQQAENGPIKVGVTKDLVQRKRQHESFGAASVLLERRHPLYRQIEAHWISFLSPYQYRGGSGQRELIKPEGKDHLEPALDQAIKRAERIAEQAERLQALKEVKNTTGKLLRPTEQAQDLARHLAALRAEQKRLKLEEESIVSELGCLIGEADGVEEYCTWKLQARKTFDRKSFEADHPKLAEKYIQTASTRVLRLL